MNSQLNEYLVRTMVADRLSRAERLRHHVPADRPRGHRWRGARPRVA